MTATRGLTFSEATHRYRLDGRPVPGVTGLISGGIPKPALVSWASKVIATWVADNPDGDWRQLPYDKQVKLLQNLPNVQRDTAAVRGTDVHDLAERLIHGQPVEVPDMLAPWVYGYVRWLDAWQPDVILTEHIVANRQWWYAGKFDAIVTLGGERWLLDWKTSKGVYGDTALQTAAYRNAEFYLGDDGAEHPMPEVDRCGVVHITPAGSTLYPLDSTEAPWWDFLHAAHTARHDKARKGYLGEPLEPATTTGAVT